MKLKFKKRLFKTLDRLYKEHFLKPLKLRLKYEFARGYRYLLNLHGKVRFVGITGSCGKTMTTELIAAVLAKQGSVVKCSHRNTIEYITDTILSVSPRHRFCVNELSGDGPGVMKKSAKLFSPHIGIVTNIGQDHYSSYRTLEAVAAEKSKLVKTLPANGTAVLNADDSHVFDMHKCTKAGVLTYGLSLNAMVRGESVSCFWPKPMSLDICYGQKRLHVQTRLLGEHWAYAVLAAVAAGIAAGVSLESAIEAIEIAEPIPYRMCPHTTPDGITFISDNRKAPLWAIPASLDFMRKAQARKKVLIVGSISDTPKSFSDRYKAVIRPALDIVDKIIFVGDNAYSALRTRPNLEDKRVMAFGSLFQLNSFLNNYLTTGDLVLLKGLETTDHLQRIILSRIGHITCWRDKCGKKRFCSDCSLLNASSESHAE